MQIVPIKNFWSLNVDEALVAFELKNKPFKKKNYEVFFPVNAQSEGIDLILLNKNTKKTVTIQVKGSKPYGPPDYEDKNHVKGGYGAWFNVPKEPTKITDFFVLVVSTPKSSLKRKAILKSDYLVIPTSKIIEIRRRNKKSKMWSEKQLHLFFYGEGKSKKAEVQCKKEKKSGIDLSQYLNKSGWNLIKKEINRKNEEKKH